MTRPNIIFILIDDMGWTDVCCYGSSFYETPNLDRLAREGMRFTDAYAACPVCSPTRASLMTGRYPARVGVTNYIAGQERGRVVSAPFLHHLPLSETSVATALREGGYATWHVGKWHLGGPDFWPQHHGFDANIGGWDTGYPRSYFSPYHNPMLPDGPEGEYLIDRLTDEAITLIREHVSGNQRQHSPQSTQRAQREEGSGSSLSAPSAGNPPPAEPQPFFLNLWHYAVHTPIQSKPELVEKYKRKAAALGLDRREALEEGEHFPCEHKKHMRVVRRRFQSDPAYAAMVQTLDENVGRLMATLEELGLAENTILFFTSDNGGLSTAEGSPTCNAPLSEGKGWMYEGGTREPMLVKWPGVTRPDSLCSVPITSPDLFPTLLEMADLPLRPDLHCDGVSFAPLLRGGEALDREAIFWHYPHYGNQGGTPGCSVRCGDWKLIEFFEDSSVELYNLREDVSETTNLAAHHPDIVQRLRDLLHQWQQDVAAKLPTPNPEWKP